MIAKDLAPRLRRKAKQSISRLFPRSVRELQTRVEQEMILFWCENRPFRHVDSWLSAARGLHRGERCFICATGPSLKKIDLSRVRPETTFGVNAAYKIADELNLDYYVNASNWFYKDNLEGIRSVACKRRFLPRDLPMLASDVPTSWLNVRRARYWSMLNGELRVPEMFSKDADRFVVLGGTVTYLCLQLAFYLGFNEVIMLGLDHSYGKSTDAAANQFGGTMLEVGGKDQAHFDSSCIRPGTRYFVDLGAMERGYEMAQEAFERHGRRIYNASPGSHLETFEKVDFESLF